MVVGDLVVWMGLLQDSVGGAHYPLTGISVQVKFMRDEGRIETRVGSLKILIPVIKGYQKMKARAARRRAGLVDKRGNMAGARKTMKKAIHQHKIVAVASNGKRGSIVD
jgi:hypothetical protein